MAEHLLLDRLRVIVGDGTVLTDAAVLLQGDTIVAVGASADMDIPADTIRIDLAGKTLLPTLIDVHAHLGYEGTSSCSATPTTVSVRCFRRAAGEAGGARLVFAVGMARPGQ